MSPDCPEYGYQMNRNGYNEYCKKGPGSVKIRRCVCPICEEPLEEPRILWKQLKTDFFNLINSIHQLCLLHLNKLIVGDFPKHGTIEQELMKYRMLNIFCNRDAEIQELARNGERSREHFSRLLRRSAR